TVSATVPANLATSVALGSQVAGTFSEPMDASTISTATFTLKQGTTPVAGTVSYSGVTATFTPTANLAPLTTYTARINTGARDLAGNALSTDIIWSFTTGPTPDTTSPTVSAILPADANTGVAINQTITVTFSEAMDPATIGTTSFLLTGPGETAVAGTVVYDVASKTASFTPVGDLAPNAVYTATLTTGATDLAGNALAADLVWSFTRGTVPDITAPTVSPTVPANLSTSVAISSQIAGTFSEPMDASTISTATFTLKQGTTPVAGTVSYSGVTTTFTPTANLAPLTTYTARISTGARDLAGNALSTDLVWSFT